MSLKVCACCYTNLQGRVEEFCEIMLRAGDEVDQKRGDEKYFLRFC